MAIHAHSTPMPAPQRGLLRAFAGSLPALSFEARSAPGLVSAHDTLATVEALAAPGSTALRPCSRKGLAPKEALASTAVLPFLPPEPEPDTAAQARALHMRRELRKGLDRGLALMDALDLTPRDLDLMDCAIAQLDALEAPDEHLEPYLAGYCGHRWCDLRSEAEDADSLEIHGEGDFLEDAEDDDPAEETSLETFGRGFVRCGADDVEEDDGCERGEEYGSEDGEDIGHHASQFTPRPLSHAERAEVAVIATRAAAMRKASHV